MVSFATIKPGDVLYEVRREKMGNTTMSRQAVRTVRIVEVHDGWALASWNGNSPTRWHKFAIEKLRRSAPKPKPSLFERAAQARLNTQGEAK